MQSQQQQQQSINFWKPAAIGSILLAMTQLYDPLKDIYLTVYNPEYKGLSSVRLASYQQELNVRNWDCSREMQPGKVQVNENLYLTYGVCPNLNVYIGVYPKNLSAYFGWVEPNRSDEPRVSGLFSQAFAVAAPLARPEAAPKLVPAQTTLKTLCQSWHNAQRTKVDRITNDSGQCYYERVNTLSGVVEIRETVPCDSQCEPTAKKFN